jgi:hypothetical protein
MPKLASVRRIAEQGMRQISLRDMLPTQSLDWHLRGSLRTAAAVVVALLAFPTIGHATPFFVQAGGNAQTEVINTDDPTNTIPNDNQSFVSTDLPQTSLSLGPISSSELGSSHSNGNVIVQRADASVSGTATIGALHADLNASANDGNHPTGGLNFGQAAIGVQWSDTVFFQTSRPGGSDFTVSLALDDLISFSSIFAGNSTSFESGTAVANATMNGVFLLGVQDTANQSAATHPPSFTVSTTIHVVGGESVVFGGTLELRGKVSDAISSVEVDADDTALFTLFSADPDASYTTASGVSFLPVVTTTTVPEPTSAALLMVGLTGLAGLRRGTGRRSRVTGT